MEESRRGADHTQTSWEAADRCHESTAVIHAARMEGEEAEQRGRKRGREMEGREEEEEEGKGRREEKGAKRVPAKDGGVGRRFC